jgi:predicted enzyme related to lactoylglutathione lyase
MEPTQPMKKRDFVRAAVGLLLISALAAACVARKPTFAPITTHPDAAPAHGKFVWYDLLTEDVDGVSRFYGELLGWKFIPTESPNYTLIEHGGRHIGGIVDMTAIDPDVNQSQWISLLSVPDVAAAARATRDAGGEIHVEPREIRGRGTLAVVSDPYGALLAYARALGGDPPDLAAGIGDFMWTELWTDDLEGSYAFYRDLIGYNLDEEVILDDVEYIVFSRGDKPRAGVIVLPIDKVRSHWMPYVRVADPADLVARVEQLGGKVLISPDESIRHGTVAVVLDPSGAAVALQQWGDS